MGFIFLLWFLMLFHEVLCFELRFTCTKSVSSRLINKKLGGGFKNSFISPLPGEDSHFD